MPTSINIRWYETSENLDRLHVVHYSRPVISIPVVAVGVGGILVNWEHVCKKWRTKWEKTDGRFEVHFELKDEDYLLSDPLNLTLPVAKFTDKWFKANGHPFYLEKSINNRVFQLLRFLDNNGILVQGGTLFILTQAGIMGALAENRDWSLVMGYSAKEPAPDFNSTPMHYDIPEIRLPKAFEVLNAPKPTKLSRYERPWVI